MRRRSSLITDIGRDVGPWQARLGNRLQEPGVNTAFSAQKEEEHSSHMGTQVSSLGEQQAGETGAAAGTYRALGAPAEHAGVWELSRAGKLGLCRG